MAGFRKLGLCIVERCAKYTSTRVHAISKSYAYIGAVAFAEKVGNLSRSTVVIRKGLV
jgi:hypothetical protein